ncbi:MAG: 1-deoxy-D-xylulose-5-phosphate reductoisomerase [Hyphomonas sp.]|uniref:1-deoxy-D-xylulose-5-phosphate reductoisomerase n=1 Tax=Hyphomonas sp. TaxID=87 RepID=UPI00184E2DCB|nr:1-deoxy-D-xylulose-5-phosphate reductoisomerase [Hyphomonas sp.]MBA3069669.1 1-deoxy-D-xylulose-5-phosphate reductoisomerase [Hyphomonas sp.]MBU3921563.1 1-deoxy-D-xylulose-5-phosphate reductoisomerase [Alphaproteobacteria bacterium]MBU4062510.1 1-deoxy-D-xylulose-5-phosphate reductoisomerase [Alphaproteobacteria bacterium]MBU4163861.1 1-deoxy-D-xylulose-5-phosphate reductoisomerase [Alphaproteobacteria bacterium]
MKAPRRISIFGSTGSVGQSTVDVIRHANRSEARFELVALAAGRNASALAMQALELRPEVAVIADEAQLPELRARLAGSGIAAAAGESAMLEAAARPCDRFLAAIVGAAGLKSTMAAVEAGNHLALANKESLVCAGSILLDAADRAGITVMPVDSEHSAIFQCLGDGRSLEKLTLTASGGPFRLASLEEMARATPAQAAAHPKWSMGLKISIDSATLMNKALELIEAAILFRVSAERIDVLVHPQSIVHGMAHFTDGSVMAQLGAPDMRTPISLALGWPDRVDTLVERLDLAQIGQLDFAPVDASRFKSIELARRACSMGPAGPVVLNSANESAVSAFVAEDCGFLDIAWAVEAALDRFSSSEFASTKCTTLEEVAFLDQLGRRFAGDALNKAPSRAGGMPAWKD